MSRAQLDGKRWRNKRVVCWALVRPGRGIRVDPSHGAKTPGFECLFLRAPRDDAVPSWIPLFYGPCWNLNPSVNAFVLKNQQIG